MKFTIFYDGCGHTILTELHRWSFPLNALDMYGDSLASIVNAERIFRFRRMYKSPRCPECHKRALHELLGGDFSPLFSSQAEQNTRRNIAAQRRPRA